MFQNFPVADLFPILQEKTGHTMSQCQVLYNNQPLERVRHGKKMTLKDYGVNSSATLIITKLGVTLEVVNPQVGCVKGGVFFTSGKFDSLE